jgi:hypothetical protein
LLNWALADFRATPVTAEDEVVGQIGGNVGGCAPCGWAARSSERQLHFKIGKVVMYCYALYRASARVLYPSVGLGEVIFVNKYDLSREVEAEGDTVVHDPDDAVAIDEQWKLVSVGQVVEGFSGIQVVVRLLVGESTFRDPVAVSIDIELIGNAEWDNFRVSDPVIRLHRKNKGKSVINLTFQTFANYVVVVVSRLVIPVVNESGVF